jgi:hypothetical protein
MFDEATVRRTMMLLLADAKGRGMTDLAIVYGWSAMRLGNIMLNPGGRKGYR